MRNLVITNSTTRTRRCHSCNYKSSPTPVQSYNSLQVHQAFYQAGPAQIVELFSVKVTRYDSRRTKQLVLDRPKKEIGRLSLRHRGTMIWNSIPSSVKDFDNVTSFKNRLKQLSKFINNFTFEKESSMITNKSHHFYYY